MVNIIMRGIVGIFLIGMGVLGMKMVKEAWGDFWNSKKQTQTSAQKTEMPNNHIEEDKVLIENSSFETSVQNADRVVGMEVNRPAELKNVQNKLNASNVNEAIGFSTNQGLSSFILTCSKCGQIVRKVFIGQPPNSITCPHCDESIDIKK